MTSASVRQSLRILSVWLGVFVLSIYTAHARPDDVEKHPVNLDELAAALDKGMQAASVKSVAVADFLGSDGRNSELTWYLSGRLSDALRKSIGESTVPRFVSRASLPDPKLTVEEVSSPEALARIGGIWGVAAIVTATVEFSEDKYILKATVRNVSNGSVVTVANQEIPHLRFLDLLTPQGVGDESAHLKTIGVDGVLPPVCQYCPIPGYSEDARAAKIQIARLTLTVTVSTKGEPIKVVLNKDPGYGLGEVAIEGVSEWRFKPAMQNGKPVAVAVPVEVSFNLART
jgi:TonB family protein